MTDIADIIGWIIIVIVNIVGWWLAFRNTTKATIEANRIAKETAKTELTRMEMKIDNLPCIKDSTYEKGAGMMLQKVNDLEKQLDTILKLLQDRR